MFTIETVEAVASRSLNHNKNERVSPLNKTAPKRLAVTQAQQVKFLHIEEDKTTPTIVLLLLVIAGLVVALFINQPSQFNEQATRELYAQIKKGNL